MTESHAPTATLVKLLTIIGFCATLGLLVWLLVTGSSRLPGGFASLAGIAQSIDSYRPQNEFSLASEKAVVNSGESFQISWTDLKQKSGEFHLGYTCADGVKLFVRDGNGNPAEVRCDETLNMPASVHGLFVQIDSRANRFTEVTITLSFAKEPAHEIQKTALTLTVVNAMIPARLAEVPDESTKEITPEPETPTVPPTPTPTPTPVPPTQPVAESGTPDLFVTILGGGTFQNGVFVFTETLDSDLRNGIRFNVQNLGAKTSSTWSFTATLPNGQTYTSPLQLPLKPHDGTIMTLGFNFDRETEQSAPATVHLSTESDANTANNSTSRTFVVTN